MGVMDNIKRKLSDISFQRKGSPNREVKAINIKHAQTVGIVYRADNDETKELVERYVKFLKEYKIKCKTLGYYDMDELPRYVAPKLEFDYFLKKDLNWKLETQASEVLNFNQSEFDILIDTTVEEDDVIRFIVKQSIARFKVGGAKKDVDDLDFTINLRPEEGVRQLMKGLDNYLHLINKD
ncbi:MAG: hypothetical protein CMD20_03080 [Flavobacteriales bacterium]|nr:hypothetical protein [Flavobacteriales bacterium]|tara:strand:- start:170 stop:712 length:543 start_codon:yes stop_codon:yes gene_type:complete